MTDYAEYKRLPAQDRDEQGFAKWRENQHIGTHGPGCWKYGRNHYDCALEEIEQLRKTLETTAAVAITMLFESHKDDVKRVFSLEELAHIVAVTEPLQSINVQTEDVYRSAWDTTQTSKRTTP